MPADLRPPPPAAARPRRPAARGVTLIEAMITIVVLAILVAVALPSYAEHVDRAKRAAARQVLLEAAAWLERHYTTYGCYDRGSVAACAERTGADLALPAPLQRAPRDGRQSHAVAVTFPAGRDECPAGIGQCFTLTATPCGAPGAGCPSGSEPLRDARCNAVSLTHTGARSAGGSADLAFCWGR